MRAMLIGVLSVVVACRDTSPADPNAVAKIEITPDTAVFVLGDSAVLTAKAFNAFGEAVEQPFDWFTIDTRLIVHDGVVKAVASGRGLVGASNRSNANVRSAAVVWAQDRATLVRVGVSTSVLVVSPGVTFLSMPFAAVIVGGTRNYVDYGGYEAKKWRTLRSSNAAVADWLTYEDNYRSSHNNGWTFSAVAPGEAVLRISSNGLSDSVRIVVRGATVVSRDSSWNGGAWSICGLTATGEAWCRGNNDVGQLGTPTAPWHLCCGSVGGFLQQGSNAVVAVDTDQRFRSLATGNSFFCGLTTSDKIYCWGANDFGSLGVASSDSLVASSNGEPRCSYTSSFSDYHYRKCHFRPVRADRDLGQVLNFDDVRAQGNRVCAHVIRRGATDASLTAVDEVWCWGGDYGAPQQRPGFFQ